MNGNLLDRNVIIRILNGDQQLAESLEKLDNIVIPSIVIGELLFGAEKSSKPLQNKEVALEFCRQFREIPVNHNVAVAYGSIKANLQKHGKIIPENDMWIGAIAFANDLTVISQDKHLKEIDSISVLAI